MESADVLLVVLGCIAVPFCAFLWWDSRRMRRETPLDDPLDDPEVLQAVIDGCLNRGSTVMGNRRRDGSWELKEFTDRK